MLDLLPLFTAVSQAKANLRTAEERLKEGCAEWSRDRGYLVPLRPETIFNLINREKEAA